MIHDNGLWCQSGQVNVRSVLCSESLGLLDDSLGGDMFSENITTLPLDDALINEFVQVADGDSVKDGLSGCEVLKTESTCAGEWADKTNGVIAGLYPGHDVVR